MRILPLTILFACFALMVPLPASAGDEGTPLCVVHDMARPGTWDQLTVDDMVYRTEDGVFIGIRSDLSPFSDHNGSTWETDAQGNSVTWYYGVLFTGCSDTTDELVKALVP